MTIRPAQPADFEAIYAIWLAGIAHSFAGFAHPADLREQFEHTFTSCRLPFGFWVAEEAGLVLGCCSCKPDRRIKLLMIWPNSLVTPWSILASPRL